MNLFIKRCLLITTILLSTFTFADDDFDKGFEEFSRGNHQAAFKLWEKSAKNGNTKAAVNVGVSYLKGSGTNQNYSEAMRWLKIAAIKGEIHSKHLIGEMYLKGQGVTQSNFNARAWFGISVAQGNTLSQSFLIKLDDELSTSEKIQIKKIVDQCTTSQFIGCHF